jgi:putative transcriptional regulator
MSRHMAPEEMLLDYTAGTLAAGPALVVTLHLALNPEARRSAERLAAVGGALMEGEVGAALDDDALGRALARLDEAAVEPPPAPYVPRPGFAWAPPPLARYLGPRARWRRVLGGFEEIRLDLPGDHHRASLLRLEPGHGLPAHSHVGAEYTVVLQGGFTDSTGNYVAGDFAQGRGAEAHEPIADAGEPCIALIVLDKPIVLTNRFARLLNPLVRRGLI